jgi:hypothetical protein
MTETVDQTTLDLLVRIGSLVTVPEMEGACPPDLISRDRIDHVTSPEWERLTEKMANKQVVSVLRALVVLGRLGSWRAGSVSSQIWVYYLLERRGFDNLPRVIKWCRANTHNDWMPTGRNNFD